MAKAGGKSWKDIDALLKGHNFPAATPREGPRGSKGVVEDLVEEVAEAVVQAFGVVNATKKVRVFRDEQIDGKIINDPRLKQFFNEDEYQATLAFLLKRSPAPKAG